MQLPPLATNTTNTNWWTFPSLPEMVNVPPSPRLAPVPLLVEVIVCLLVLFACFFLSVYLSVYFPLVLSMSSAKMYTLLHSASILTQICSPERSTKTSPTPKTDILSVKRSTENAGQTDRLCVGSVFSACPRHCLHSLSDHYLHISHMHM